MRRTTAAIGIGAAGAAVWGLTRLLRKDQHMHLTMEQRTGLPADVVIARVADVRSEPTMIPYVRSVEMLKESDRSAEYIVSGRTLGIPWWVHYAKQWDYGSNTARWHSVDGSYGIEHTGRLSVVCEGGRNVIKLTTGYSVKMPKVEKTVERIAQPLLAYALGVWLKRLSR